MNQLAAVRKSKRLGSLAFTAGLVSLVMAMALSLTGGTSQAANLAAIAPGLGQAAAYSALGKAGVTNSGNSQLSGNIGADLDAAMTGFIDSVPPGPGVYGGSRVSAPSVNQAEADASTAHLALAAQAGSAVPINPALTGQTLVAGAYTTGAALLTGVLTLDGPGVYVFIMSSDLTVSGSINFVNGARPCDVFWHVTSSAAFTGGAFAGTVIAGASITFGNGASLDGRALALTGNVTLINNAISGPNCPAGQPATDTSTPTSSATASSSPTASNTSTASPSPTASRTLMPGEATFTPMPTETHLPSETPAASSTPVSSLTPLASITPLLATLAPAATATAMLPSYVDVETQCAVNGLGEVRIGMSAGVTVYGLGPDITSATDTGANKIIRFLPVGHYDWHATPPAGHYMQTASSGSIDIPVCGTPVATAVEGSTPVATAVPTATEISILIPATGADLVGDRALAARQWVRISLVALGLGLVLAGYTLKRKQLK